MAPQSEEPARSLSESINIATRSVHTKLNKLVIYRLPLSIPPRAEDPSNYVSGLLHITPVYSAFESIWRSILTSTHSPETKSGQDDSHEDDKLSPDTHHIQNGPDAPDQLKICDRTRSLLTLLHTPELERTKALKADIQSLTGWSDALLDEQLSSTSESPVLAGFLLHINEVVRDRPHLLVAYAWVLYMALFSGGRFIRASLARVDAYFWAANVVVSSASDDNEYASTSPPLRFFTFEDGEETKLGFKRLMVDAERLLTAEERDDVVAEAKRIFYHMVEIVGELDGVCETDAQEVEGSPSKEGVMSRMGRLLGLRTRDSVVVTKERRTWASLMKSSSRDGSSGEEAVDDDEAEHVNGNGHSSDGNGDHVRFQ